MSLENNPARISCMREALSIRGIPNTKEEGFNAYPTFEVSLPQVLILFKTNDEIESVIGKAELHDTQISQIKTIFNGTADKKLHQASAHALDEKKHERISIAARELIRAFEQYVLQCRPDLARFKCRDYREVMKKLQANIESYIRDPLFTPLAIHGSSNNEQITNFCNSVFNNSTPLFTNPDAIDLTKSCFGELLQNLADNFNTPTIPRI